MKAKQRKLFTKEQFDDQEAYEEIKEQIRKIRQKNLRQVQEEEQIMRIYEDKKKQLKRRRMQQMDADRKQKGDNRNRNDRQPHRSLHHELGEEDQQEGEINENKNIDRDKMEEQDIEQMPSIRNLGEHIRPITLTRNKVCDFLMSRKFQDIVKGCFVRYKTETSSGNTNQYLLAQVIGVIEGPKQYVLSQSTRTNKFLKLQQSSQEVIPLSIQHLSNQHPQGSLQISAWIRTNRNKIPKQKQLRQKLEQLNNLMYGKVSSEEIDRNIYAESVGISEGKIQPKGDLSKYIYFMEGQLHDITFSIQQLESKEESSKKSELEKKNQERIVCQDIIANLKKKKAQIAAEKANLRKIQAEKSKNQIKKYSQIFFQDRKEDKINDKVNKKLLLMSTHEGTLNILNEIKSAHQNCSIDFTDLE